MVSPAFNPFQVWLGLGESVADPNHLEMLGLDEAEDNLRTIAAAADRAASRVRGCRPGEHAAEWAALLDRIAVAKKCLTDPRLRDEYLKSLRAGNPAADKSLDTGDRPPAAAKEVDPNMYPPGLAPATARRNRTPADNTSPSSVAPPEKQQDGRDFPVPSPVPGVMRPDGVPYLQPAAPSGMADPMHPAIAPAGPYSVPLGVSPMAPLVPNPMEYGSPMAAVVPETTIPMAAIPLAIPFGAGPLPMAQAPPPAPTNYNLPMAARSSLEPVAAPSPAETWSVNRNSAAMLTAKHSQGSWFGPVLFGLAAGAILLSIGIGVVVLRSGSRTSDRSAVASVDSEPGIAVPASSTVHAPAPAAAPIPGANRPLESPDLQDNSGTRTVPDPGPNLPDLAASLANQSASTNGNDPATNATSTTDVPMAEVKPASGNKSTPVPETPAKTEELRQPTADELKKLGIAMLKAREAIGVQDFDKAEAFISAASNMPRLPQHKAMLDRLKLLSTSVGQFRTAIQESISKLESGASFQVGDSNVGVVETGPEKVILRVKGTNRTYVIRELPMGLAAALAAQTLVPDDPNTLTLKGAYVLACPNASEDDLKKAREFLEQAAESVDAAKELLLLLQDKYDLAGK